jgi:GntR family transcriptional repressor for pyruvate dehydrogenase complex
MPRAGRRTRISEQIARRIKRQISAGKLPVGARVPAEREMARRFNTSRVSVREAYRSLEELGLLTIRRGADGGAFIAEPGHNAVQRSLSLVLKLGRMTHQELTEARLMIEPPVARLAARRADADDIERLRAILDRQEATLARKGHFGPHSLQFHRMLAECARNLPLATLVNSLADLTLELLSVINTPPAVKAGICQFHRRILEAVERHDEDAAYSLMLQHIGSVQQGIGETLEQTLEHSAAPGNGANPGTQDPSPTFEEGTTGRGCGS